MDNQNLGSFQVINNDQQTQTPQTPAQAQQTLETIDLSQMGNTNTVATAPAQEQMPMQTQPMQTMGTPMNAVPTGMTATAEPAFNGDFSSLLATAEAVDPAEPAYRKLPEGIHYVKFKEIESTLTKADKPIVWIRYEAVGGEHEGVQLSESFYLGGTEKWQVERAIGNMKHRLEIDFGLANLPWAQGSLEAVAQATNALAAQLHFHATVSYAVNAKTGETSEYATIDSIVKA